MEKNYTKEELDLLIVEAEKGNLEAQIQLGGAYKFGYAGIINHEEAVKYFEMAAKQNDLTSLKALASYYSNDEDIKQDLVKAFSYIKQAADLGDANSQALAGKYLLEGYGVEKNELEANKYFKLAAEQGEETGLKYYNKELN